ncbi:hypothetical protein QUF54_08955 [Candidatus Marithioploca araucensis]|uniref:Uncharacterized protein n=1 Tax=Candidatus Marithioploca araucensis TaxID=70273 RepID=A0ABT7VV56_9GAMM|nr:hypothetical protein [Candidatus Marithioploca araucensis]
MERSLYPPDFTKYRTEKWWVERSLYPPDFTKYSNDGGFRYRSTHPTLLNIVMMVGFAIALPTLL